MKVSLLMVVTLSMLLVPMAEAANPYPNSMVAFGDSISRAFNTGSTAFSDATQNAWSTGTTASVNSQYLRILAANPAISGKNYNNAVTGARMSNLLGQVNASPAGMGYVTILMGANDACASSEAAMTTVANYQSQFASALTAIAAKDPNAQIFVASIPNIKQLWSLLKGNFWARTIWGLLGTCQSMLANPTSTSATDTARRTRVDQRVKDFNSALATECAKYANCRFDSNTVYNYQFTASQVSTRDYFHPSLAGQTKLAEITFASAKAAFGWT